MLRELKSLARVVKDTASLSAGWLAYLVTGRTPYWAGMSLIRLFCASGGRSNDLMARLIAWRYPPRPVTSAPCALPALATPELAAAAAEINSRGYHVLKHRVPDEICARLLEFALTQPATLRASEGQAQGGGTAVYDPANPRAVRYEYAQQSLIDNPDIQKLMADPVLIGMAQSYLGAEPIADVMGLWWHTAFSDKPDGEAAQFYHFDMDRIKWVKFFICLTDVASENGPHFFVEGSHRTGGIPRDLLARGYARLTDEEVSRHYATKDLIEFTAPRGTIIAEDTRGLHKGQHVHRGHRLMLQIQFSNSLFGPAYPKMSFSRIAEPALAEAARRHPRTFSAFLPARA
jgi:hypothetical protein